MSHGSQVCHPLEQSSARTSATAAIEALKTKELDILVIGGGIVGTGRALDAVTRGLRVGMLEARDWASRHLQPSSKLVHGGIRYLEQLDFRLVREALIERGLLLQRIAPHLVKPVRFLYPLTKPVFERFYIGAGMLLYDLFSYTGRPPARRAAPPPPHQAAAAARGAEPASATPSPAGSPTGTRRSTTRATSRTSRAPRASTARTSPAGSRSRASSRSAQRVVGVKAHDLETGEQFEILREAGRQRDRRLDRRHPGDGRRARPVQGAGVEGRAPRGAARPVPVEARAAAAHREERAVRDPVGPALADRHDRHRLEPRQGAPGRDRRRHRLPARARQRGARGAAHPRRRRGRLRRACVRCSRARASETCKLSREHIVAHSVPGLVVVAGGKWTTYRIMAKDAIDEAVAALDGKISRERHREHRRCSAPRATRRPGTSAARSRRRSACTRCASSTCSTATACMTDELLDLHPRATRAAASRCPVPTTTSAPRSSTRRPTRARCTSTTCSPAAPASRSRRGTAGVSAAPVAARADGRGARLGRGAHRARGRRTTSSGSSAERASQEQPDDAVGRSRAPRGAGHRRRASSAASGTTAARTGTDGRTISWSTFGGSSSPVSGCCTPSSPMTAARSASSPTAPATATSSPSPTPRTARRQQGLAAARRRRGAHARRTARRHPHHRVARGPRPDPRAVDRLVPRRLRRPHRRAAARQH